MSEDDALEEPPLLEPRAEERETPFPLPPPAKKRKIRKLRERDFEDLTNHRDAMFWPDSD